MEHKLIYARERTALVQFEDAATTNYYALEGKGCIITRLNGEVAASDASSLPGGIPKKTIDLSGMDSPLFFVAVDDPKDLCLVGLQDTDMGKDSPTPAKIDTLIHPVDFPASNELQMILNNQMLEIYDH